MRFLLTRLVDWLEHAARRAGEAEGSAGIFSQAAIPPADTSARDYGID